MSKNEVFEGIKKGLKEAGKMARKEKTKRKLAKIVDCIAVYMLIYTCCVGFIYLLHILRT